MRRGGPPIFRAFIIVAWGSHYPKLELVYVRNVYMLHEEIQTLINKNKIKNLFTFSIKNKVYVLKEKMIIKTKLLLKIP